MDLYNINIKEQVQAIIGEPIKFETMEEAEAFQLLRKETTKQVVSDLHQQILEFTAGKTYLDILPKDLIKKKRSIIKADILESIQEAYKHINNSGAHDVEITIEQLTIYMMIGTNYSNFELAYKFYKPLHEMDIWTEFMIITKEFSLTQEERSKLMDEYASEHLDKFQKYNDARSSLSFLRQAWDSYQSRLEVKNFKAENITPKDLESDGFPRTSRANVCYMYVPVKGLLTRTLEDTVNFYNPRSKKEETYTDLIHNEKEQVYSGLNSKGIRIYFVDLGDVESSWDALFSINKEIYSGWWNRILILNP